MDFVESDSDDERKPSAQDRNYSAEETEALAQSIAALKAEGNAFFTAGDHDNALVKYTVHCSSFSIGSSPTD